ncbi:MAG: DNA polymerase/3'-5' exonuclease PolX [Chloroflexi bacterium]|nr:DNA polymerase/3'-5' exonuclease PolX [Chloroflexota bacterium]
MTNKELADTFAAIAGLLEIKGEVIYKILAYRRAAETLAEYGRDVTEVWREGGPKGLREIPGVGEAISEKIDELLRTGKLGFLERLKTEVPYSLIDLLKVPGVGPKKVAMFWKQRDVTTLDELKAAALAGKLRDLPGMAEKSEAKILEGIESLSRRSGRTPLGQALPVAREMLALLRGVKGVVAAETAGSLRRMKSTVGDIDLLVASADAEPVMRMFVSQPAVARVLGQGAVKSSVEFNNGLRAQLWVHPPERFGTALQYATGSKEHNVRLRERALSQNLSLSEHALTKKNGKEILCATEEEVYAALGLPYIPPELREDRGEVQAALKGELPKLIEVADVRADLHSHSTWSDGRASIRGMAEAARARGLRVLAVTDHSQSLGVTGGLTPERLREQRREIDKVQRQLDDSILLLQGAEVEIKADGQLDYDDVVLASLDIVVASLHTSLRQPRDKVTARLIHAIRNPHVDIIGHPTGQLIPEREGADLDMDVVLAAAAESGVALEINAHPMRLDLDDVYSRRAAQMGIPLAINTDAHHPADFAFLDYGLAVARRGWVTASQVINSWPTDRLRGWLAGRGRGRPTATEAPMAAEAPRRTSATSKKKSATKKNAVIRKKTTVKQRKSR